MKLKLKPSKNRILSQKAVRLCLQTAIILLFLLYIFISWRISNSETSDQRREKNEISLPSSSSSSLWARGAGTAPITTSQSSFTERAYILFYYSVALLVSNTIIFYGISWRKEQLRTQSLIINEVFFFISLSFTLQFGGGFKTTLSSASTYDGHTLIAKSVNITAWYNNYSPTQHIVDGNIRISFSLHNDLRIQPIPDKFTGVVGYRCGGNADLPPTLSKSTILNFTTSISTNLNLLFLGDSIAEQFSQSWDASVLGAGYETHRFAKTYRNGPDNINVHNCLSVSAPIRGGGVSAFWRIATLMSEVTQTNDFINLCDHKVKTWSGKQAFDLVSHQYANIDMTNDKQYAHHIKKNTTFGVVDLTDDAKSVNAFDAIIMRIPHGWLTLQQITRERIVNAINLSNRHTGAHTVIISTLPLNNNVVTASDWKKVTELNRMIRDIARTWTYSEPGKVKHILVQEFGNFTNQILRMNAEHIQLTNTTTPDFSQDGWETSGANFLLNRLSSEPFWAPSISMVCANKTYPRKNDKNVEVEDCIRNKISRDGIHWCVETLGPRYSASISCLLGCVFNGNEPSTKSKTDMIRLRECEYKCNEQFMSILPVDERWMKNDISLYSESL